MPRINRSLSFAVLLALLLTAMPAARYAYAQGIVVTNLGDADNGVADGCGGDGCSLREAIRLANSRPGPNTITFSVSGEIQPGSELPPLTDDGTTIDGGPSRAVAINGAAAGNANGLVIRSSNNVVRNLVIYNFANAVNDDTAGMGIVINGAAFAGQPARGDNNQLYGNWIGLSPAGSAAISNRRYGLFITSGASGNIIGADTDAERNVISGNRAGGVRLVNDEFLSGVLNNNRIVGNYIGTSPTGTNLPPGLDTQGADSGIGLSDGSRNTLVSNNVIGGFNSNQGFIAAGINVTSRLTAPTSDQIATNTTITGNSIGVSRGGDRIANRIGIRVGVLGSYGPNNTIIGGTEAGARNIIAGNTFRGIDLSDTSATWGDTTIAGNYIGLDGAGNPQPNGGSSEVASGAGIYIGRVGTGLPVAAPRVTLGPGNVISANRTYGLWSRSGGHIIRGNLFGTNLQGTSSALGVTANGRVSIWLENGTGNLIGGPNPADRNIIAFGGNDGGITGGILINPLLASPTNCANAPCVSGGHTIEGNYIGVAANGTAALNTVTTLGVPEARDKVGIRLVSTTGNTIRGNLIGGLNQGITLGTGPGTGANTNLIEGNKIGAPAGGELPFASKPTPGQLAGRAPRNLTDGIKIFSGTGNTIRGNLVAYNAVESDLIEPNAGIQVGQNSAEASNNLVEGNRLVANGDSNAWGVVVDTATGVRLTRNTTQFNAGDGFATTRGGIALIRNGNNNRQPPTLTGVTAGPPATLNGSAAGCDGCTVEVFTSNLDSEEFEGPVFVTAGTTQAGGAFAIPLPFCQRYLTATVTDAQGNSSPFTAQLDTGAVGPCQPLSFSLGAADNPSRSVAPGETTIYTHTLTHNAAISVTYTVVFTSSQGWASAPAFVTVPASGSATFGVSVRVPPGTPTGAGAPVDTTDVQVFAGTQGSNVVRDTTTPQTVTVVPATPAVSGPLTAQRTGPTVTFNHVVTNTGDLAGTFIVTDTVLTGAPGDWSVGSVTPPTLTLGPQVTGTLAIVVNTPSLAPPTAPVTLSFRVVVQGSSPERSVTQQDFIVTPVARSFVFVPRASETITTPAGASVSFSYTLTNTGNAADSFSVTADPPLPAVTPPITTTVASVPALANLAPGAAAAVTVTYSVPTLTPAGQYTGTIAAAVVGGTGAPEPVTRTVTINVVGGGAVTIVPGPASVDPVVPVGAGTAVSFTNTLSNTGNAAAPVELGPITGIPPGWTASVISSTCPISPTTLAAGEACTFVVEAIVPVGSPGGPVELGISATAFNSPPDIPNVTATAVNRVNVAVVRGLELAPDGLTATTGPGQPITFTHTLTNTGNAADSYDLAASSSEAGWTVSLSPTVVSDLPAGEAQPIELVVTPGPGVTGGITSTITLTATGQGGGPSATVSDTVALEAIRGGALSPVGRRNVDPGGTAVFTFTVINTGTVPLSYTVGLTDSLSGWSSAAGGVPTAEVAPGLTTTLTVSVTAPTDATPGVTNTTTVSLLAGDGTGEPLATQEAVTGIGPRLGVILDPETLTGEGMPNSTVVLTHTLTNVGSEQGTFQLTAFESIGWSVELAPDVVTLEPGQSVPVIAQVSVKPSAEAGARSFVRIRAELLGNPEVFDESVDEVSVPLVVGLSLTSSQVRAVRVGTTASLDSLTVFNSGSAYDVFTLSISGEDADWDVILGQSTIALNRGDPARISVQVRVGATVPLGAQRTIRVEARSNTDGSVRSSVELNLTAVGSEVQPPGTRYWVYLPLTGR